MFGGQDKELNNKIGNILLDIIPPEAVRIVVNSEVGDDWAEVRLEFVDGAGKVGHFSFDELPRRACGEISNALIDLRTVMAHGGGAAWNRSVFTVHRDGRFDVSLSYEESPDS